MGRGPSIEGRKNAEDSKRAKLFTKLIREITVAAREGGGEPATNPRPRPKMAQALYATMYQDTMERRHTRGFGARPAQKL